MPGPYSSLMVLRRRASRRGAGRAVRGTKSGTRGGPPTEIIGLCSGPGPKLKSVEFSGGPSVYTETIFFFFLGFHSVAVHLLGARLPHMRHERHPGLGRKFFSRRVPA